VYPENQPGSLAERLFRLRKAAGLTGDQLGERLGWQYGKSKVSKIESGKQLPSADEVRAWAEAAGHPEQAAELIGLLAGMQITHTRWRQRLKAGHTPVRSDFGRRTREAARFRNAELVLIPGLLQTAGYARSIMTQVSAVYGTRALPLTFQGFVPLREI